MGVNNVCFLACDRSRALEVGDAVVKSLRKWNFERLDAQVKKVGAANRIQFVHSDRYNSERWSLGVKVESYGFDYFHIIFGCGDGGEGSAIRRVVSFCPTCHNDYNDVHAGDKMIFSISKWGLADEIIIVMATALQEFGPVYVSVDGSGDFFEEVKGE